MARTKPNLIGQVFGRLAVLEKNIAVEGQYWICLCRCGTEKSVRQDHLLTGKTQSCGCLAREVTKQASFKHGHTSKDKLSETEKYTSTYMSWMSMKNRCLKPKNNRFAMYGGRGITICDKWLKFSGFLEDMGERPLGTSIERKDTNGNYNKENCCWATNLEQANNKTTTRYETYRGETKPLSQWCRDLNLKYTRVYHRLTRLRWTVEAAFEIGKKVNQYD